MIKHKKQITVDNHYLPQFYLRRFEDKNPDINGKTLGVYNKEDEGKRNKFGSISSPRGQMYGKNLYWIGDDPEKYDQNEYEDRFKNEIEDPACDLLNRYDLRSNQENFPELSVTDFSTIVKFLGLQITRVPNFLKNIIIDTEKLHRSIKISSSNISKENFDKIREFFHPKRIALEGIFIIAEEFLNILKSEDTLRYGIFKSNNQSLITGDCPVLQFEKGKLLNSKILNLSADTFILPIDRYSFLIILRGDFNTIFKNADYINQCIIRSAINKVVFHPADREYVEKQVIRNRQKYMNAGFGKPSTLTSTIIEICFPILNQETKKEEEIKWTYETLPPDKNNYIHINNIKRIYRRTRCEKETFAEITYIENLKNAENSNLKKLIKTAIEQVIKEETITLVITDVAEPDIDVPVDFNALPTVVVTDGKIIYTNAGSGLCAPVLESAVYENGAYNLEQKVYPADTTCTDGLQVVQQEVSIESGEAIPADAMINLVTNGPTP